MADSTPPPHDQPAGQAEALLDALPCGVLVLSGQRCIERINRQAAYWCGAGPEALLHRSLAEAPLPPALAAALHELLENPGAVPPDSWLPHARQWVSLRLGPAPAGQHWVFWENATARHQAEAARQRSSQLLLDIEAVAHTGSYAAALATGSFYFSDGMYRLFGEEPQAFEVTLEVIDARSHPDDAAAIQQVLDEAIRTRQPYTYRRRIRRADGQWRTLEAHGEVRCDAAGVPVQLRGLVQDVSERVQAERHLQQSQQLLRRTIDSSPDMVQVFEAVRDEQGTVVDFTWVLNNAAAQRQYGNVIGQRLCQLNPGVVEEGIFDTFRQVLATGVPNQAERHYVHEQFNGWFHQSVVKLGDGVTTTTRDITERKQAEQQLRESQQLLHTVFEASLNPIAYHRAVRDAAGRIVDFEFQLENREARQYAVQERRGQRHSEAYPGILDTEVFGRYCAVVETGQPLDAEVAITLKGQERWFHLLAVKLDDGLVATAVDVTERRRSAAEILRLKEEIAEQATHRYDTIFNAIDEGFYRCEVLFDAASQPVDILCLEENPAAVRLSGQRFTGRRLREISVPYGEPWHRAWGEVALTGVSQRFDARLAAGQRWLSVFLSKVGGPASREVAVVFQDITARKQAEEQLRLAAAAETFRLELADALAPLNNPVAIQEAVTRTTRRHFQADRCYYCEIENGQAIIRRDAAAEGLPPVAGTYPLADFALLQAVIEAGQPFGVRDVRQDPTVDDNLRQLCVQLQVISYLDVPVMKNGQPVGVLCLVQSQPRDWTAAEATLAAEVAERTWAAIERARVEEALRESENQFRAVANLVPDLLWRSTPDSDTTWYNQQWCEYTGQTPAEAAGYGWADAMHPDDRAASARRYRAAVAGGQPLYQEHRIRSARGEYRWFQVRARPVHNAQGDITAWFGAATYIHARKQAELALAASEQRLQTLIANLPGAAVFIVDRELRYQLAEGEALRAVGFGPADFRGRLVREMAPPGQWPAYRRYYAQALAGQPFEAEHAQGGRTFLTRGVPLPGPDGAVATVLAVSYDITVRKQAEAALREAETRHREQLEQQVAARTRELRESRDWLRSVFDTSLIAMSVLQAVRDEAGAITDFRILAVNKELEQQTGRRDLEGRLYQQEYPGIVEVGVYDLLLQALATGQPQGMEYYYGHEGLHHWFACQFVQLGDGVVATNLDITERKQAEQALRANLALLEQAEQVAGLGSWVVELATGTLRWSAGMYRLFGLTPGTPVQPKIYLAHALPADRAVAERVVQALTTAPADLAETLRLQVGGEVRTLRLQAVLRPDETGQPAQLLGVDLDISEVQRLEADNLRLRLSQQQALFGAVQAAQEEERRRMAETLHNGIGQLLYATKLQLDRLPDAPEPSPRRQAARLLSDAIRQTRALSHELTPALLEEFGLAAALQRICRTLSTPALRWHCHLVLDEGPALAPSLQLAVYRLAQELAQNVVKHAQASEGTLEVEILPDWVVLRVEDNGRGFDPAATSDGLGLRTLRSRVALLGGSVHLSTAPGQGTQCQVRLPLTPTL